MSNATINIYVRVFVWACVFISLEVEVLGHIVTLCSAFWGTTKASSAAATPFFHSHRNVWAFQFLSILANTPNRLLTDFLVFTHQSVLCIAARVVILKFKAKCVANMYNARAPFTLRLRGLIHTIGCWVLRGTATPCVCWSDLNLLPCSGHARPRLFICLVPAHLRTSAFVLSSA